MLDARDLATDGKLAGFSIELWPGEILGIAGLEGMGQRDLFFALFGMIVPSAGTISVGGKPVTFKSPRDAAHPHMGTGWSCSARSPRCGNARPAEPREDGHVVRRMSRTRPRRFEKAARTGGDHG